MRRGSLILTGNNLDTTEITSIRDLSGKGVIELSAIYVGTLKMTVVCLYRPPQGDFGEFLERLEMCLGSFFARSHPLVVIAGDFNVDFTRESGNKLKTENIFGGFDLHRVFSEPSRITLTSSTCIDNVFTNLKEDTYFTSTLNFHISDHRAQKMAVDMPSENN